MRARGRRFATAVFVAIGAALVAAPPAAAIDPVRDAIAALRVSNLYVAPDVTGVTVDRGLAAGLPIDLKIAVLPVGAGSAESLATKIDRGLGAGPRQPLTVGVVLVAADGRITVRADSSKYCPGVADAVAQAAASAGQAQVHSSGGLTAIIQDFAQRLDAARIDTGECPAAASRHDSSPSVAWAWLLGIALAGAVGVGGLFGYGRRRQRRDLDHARAKVTGYYDLLGSQLEAVDPGDVAEAGQALADAHDRFAVTGGLLAAGEAAAEAAENYEIARRTALEGLHAVRAAREALGADPGPALPPPEPSRYERLDEPREITVRGQQHRGYPSYAPGAPYYYAGDVAVPGGWYETPFWDSHLLSTMFGGSG